MTVTFPHHATRILPTPAPTDRAQGPISRRNHALAETVTTASALVSSLSSNGIRLTAALAPLTSSGYLPTGCTISVGGTAGKTSLLLELLAGATCHGHWAAVLGMPCVGLVAASQCGVDLSRLALIPAPGSQWLRIVSDLLGAMELVVACPPAHIGRQQANRLAALTRQHNNVLILCPSHDSFPVQYEQLAQWPIPTDYIFEARDAQWTGISDGHGSLSSCSISVIASGRRETKRRQATLRLSRSCLTGTPAG